MLRFFGPLVPVALLCAGVAPAATADDAIEFSSGDKRVALVELYTSQGCSSCPPADRWLSRLKDDPQLWSAYVPIAFHVDYWNYIGWDDRFASAQFSARQRRYAREGGTRAVYTPGVFRDGQEWRGWRRDGGPRGDGPDVGNLRVRIAGNEVQVEFDARGENPPALTAHVALLGMRLQTQVKAGENRGRTLHHDFVALGVSAAPLEYTADTYRAALPLPHNDLRAGDRALVAWVSGRRTQAPIQSTGGYLSN